MNKYGTTKEQEDAIQKSYSKYARTNWKEIFETCLDIIKEQECE